MAAKLDTSSCDVPSWLPGGHLQTIHASLLARYHRIAFARDRVETPDRDFVDFDWAGPGLFPHKPPARPPAEAAPLEAGASAAARWITPTDWQALPQEPGAPALILFHGLEGSSGSNYAQTIAAHFRSRGWVVVVAHFRGCSGSPNRLARAYHSGDSADIAFMLDAVRRRLPRARWYAAGVSLGGNALLKYLGEQEHEAGWLTACAGVSVPLDLVAGGAALGHGIVGRQIYTRYFLRTMRRKVLEKASRYPGVIDVMRIVQAHDLHDFDDTYTAPMHGFRNALDYWSKASSKPWLASVRVPTLVLNARNDPFLPARSLPTPEQCSDRVLLHQPELGGHAGFAVGRFPANLNWLPERLGRFFETGA
ncbi:YheT family hydrolase [Bordetella sp. FB-8]|uniref:YheT family hydrolase n=1 Tax=Bordetella sp. FB-8 TaxID=1159870 RepID=UPI000477D8CF|nr:alpha/beta fold hydrolase [Bordetella sp. FB-8]